ncbi:MAG: DUF192 domain-containing protein [Candidatus Hydrogenedentota bacterium]
MKKTFRLYKEDNTLLISQIEKADSFLERLKGLMFRSNIDDDYGLWIEPCNSIHMLGMRFSIDVIYIDSELRILKLVKNLKPYRFSFCFNAHSALETRSGFVAKTGLCLGEKLKII